MKSHCCLIHSFIAFSRDRLCFPVLVFSLFFSFAGCRTSSVSTLWRSDPLVSSGSRFSRIAVAGIFPDSQYTLRQQVEHILVNRLRKEGFPAVAALQQYGAHGLTRHAPEYTFRQLCNEGTDALLLVALVDQAKDSFATPFRTSTYPSVFFYHRALKYPNITGGLPDAPPAYYWEATVIDLLRLSPVCVVRSNVMHGLAPTPLQPAILYRLMHQLFKEKVFFPPVTTNR